MKLSLYFSVCCLFVLSGLSQNNELKQFDCNYCKQVTVPFNYSEEGDTVMPLLNQVVFYSYRDQYTYWYKITPKTNETIKFNVKAINDSDEYSVYIYQYNGADFCNKLFYKKIKPITKPFDVVKETNPKKQPYKTLQVIKDNVYYISILNTSINNCGQELALTYNLKDTLYVKALHLPCKAEIASVSVTTKAELAPLKKAVKQDSLALKPVTAKTQSIVATAQNTVSAKEVVVVKNAPKKDTVIANTVAVPQKTITPIRITQPNVSTKDAAKQKSQVKKDTSTVKAIVDLPVKTPTTATQSTLTTANTPIIKQVVKQDSVALNVVTTKTKTITPLPVKQATTEVLVQKEIVKTEAFDASIICTIKNSKTLAFVNAKLTVTDDDTKDVIEFTSKEIGNWVGVKEKDKMYKFKCTAFGYKDIELVVSTNEKNFVELLIDPLKVGDNFVMKSIYFHPNTYALRKESNDELQKLLSFLTSNTSVSIEIQGYTNGDNKIFKNKAYANLSEEWNFQGSSKKLSLNRAESIKRYLITNGIDEQRLKTNGFGGDKPIIKDPETMEEGQRNIRVEVLILGE